jgi:DNA-binding NtrC family response regulator
MSAKSIAVIDDESDIINLFKEALQMEGFNVHAFADPIEAFNHIQKSPMEYGLILSDFKMPVMNGNELCTKLLNLNHELKIILMSAFENIEYDTSKFTFIQKPMSIARLLKTVKESLNEQKSNTKFRAKAYLP